MFSSISLAAAWRTKSIDCTVSKGFRLQQIKHQALKSEARSIQKRCNTWQFLEKVYLYFTIGIFIPGWLGLIFSHLLVKLLDLIWICTEYMAHSLSSNCSFFFNSLISVKIYFSRDSATEHVLPRKAHVWTKETKMDLQYADIDCIYQMICW